MVSCRVITGTTRIRALDYNHQSRDWVLHHLTYAIFEDNVRASVDFFSLFFLGSFYPCTKHCSHIFMSRYVSGVSQCGGCGCADAQCTGGCTTTVGLQSCGCKMTLPTSGAYGPAVCGRGNSCSGPTSSCVSNCGGCNSCPSCPGTLVVNPLPGAAGACLTDIPVPVGGPPMMPSSYPQTPK